jgi:Lanthionine synthetase C-like protein/HopA1 effector protein family
VKSVKLTEPTIANGKTIEAALRSLHILPDLTAFEWFGQPIKLPDEFVLGDPALRRKLCVEAVTDCLYENYYCFGKCKPYIYLPPADVRTSHSRFVRSVINSCDTQVSWWEFPRVRVEDSSIVGAIGNLLIYTNEVNPGGDDTNSNPRNQSKPNRSVKAAGRSWSLNASPGFVMFFGRADLTGETLHRLYWNLNASGASAFIAAVTYQLNRRSIRFRQKVLADPRVFDRRSDAAVTYLDIREKDVQRALLSVYREVRVHLNEQTPAMTQQIAPGLAIAEDPGGGESFGRHRCNLIAEACVRAVEEKVTEESDVVSCVRKHFLNHDIDMFRPHRRISSKDRSAEEFKRFVYRQNPPRLSVGASLSEIDGCDWLKIAKDIGRQLVADAFFHEGRRQWIGGQARESKQRVSETLPASFYDGTAGVGLFLSELAAHSGQGEIAETALGAVRQALACQPNESDPNGLYVGSLGIAVIALRTARQLDDQNLADRATDVARDLVAASMPTELHPDLMYGAAGQILGFLALGQLLSDDAFRARATLLGYRLLEGAEQEESAWSWPNPMIASTNNLTGLSHGTAGIAYALGHLWRATGDKSFRTAALGAIAYEDIAYNVRVANWPDYRKHDNMGGTERFPSFWCHGGAGIILSRVHLSRLASAFEPSGTIPDATQALRMTVETHMRLRYAGFSLCHGLAGNSEILNEASISCNGSQPWQRLAAQTASACLRIGAAHHGLSRNWPCGEHGDSPSLFLGRAGIGYAYLRRHDPSVPSVLAFDPNQWCLAT